MVLGVPREATGVSFQCARPESFAPGRGTPAEPGDGVGRAALGARASPPGEGTSGGQARAEAPARSALGGREKGEEGAEVGGSDPGN